MRTAGRLQFIIILIPMLVLMAGFTGIIPRQHFLLIYVLTIVGVVGYIVSSFLYPYFTVAGRPFLSVAFYRSSNESEFIFGKIVETKGGILFRECPGGRKNDICVEVQGVPFLETSTPYRLIVLRFPDEVNPDELFDYDYVYPETGIGKVPVRIAYLGGVQVGERTETYKTTFKSIKDRILEKLGKKVEKMEKVPIVYVTRYKIADIRVLNEIKNDLRDHAGFYEDPVKGVKAWVEEFGSIKIISTELEELRAENMKLRQIIKGLERIYHEPPSVVTTVFEVLEESETRTQKIVKYVGIGLASVAILLFIMFMLGFGR